MDTTHLRRRKPRELATAYLAVEKQEVNPHREIIDQAILPYKDEIRAQLHLPTTTTILRKILIGSGISILYPDQRQEFGINEALWKQIQPELKRTLKRKYDNWKEVLKYTAQAVAMFPEHRREIIALLPAGFEMDLPHLMKHIGKISRFEETEFTYIARFTILLPHRRNELQLDHAKMQPVLNFFRSNPFSESIPPEIMVDFFLAFPQYARSNIADDELRCCIETALTQINSSRGGASDTDHYVQYVMRYAILTADHISIDEDGVHIHFSEPQHTPTPLPVRTVV